jgi:hypothetical protein
MINDVFTLNSAWARIQIKEEHVMKKMVLFLYNEVLHSIVKFLFYGFPLKGDVCSSVIKEELSKEKPSMIGRFGSSEIRAVLYPRMPRLLQARVKKRVYFDIGMHAGFFPVNEETLKRYSDLLMEDMKLVDILASWRIEEVFLKKYFSSAKRIEYVELEPYFQDNPWTEVLANKKVLVIHPFNNTIESQYKNNRDKLFVDKRVLPEFKSLETIRAVQTIGGNRENFHDWFEALEFMKNEINKKDFDIAILGCGAYGFPLAAHIKRIGKKSIYMGGATQILFGIKGRRWLSNSEFSNIINEHFIFPGDADKPKNWENSQDIINTTEVGYW